MKRIVSLILVIVVFSVFLSVGAYAYTAATPGASSPWYGVCSGNGVRIRSSMDTSSTGNIVGQIDSNNPVEVIGVPSNSWYQVRYDTNGNVGYISSSYITIKSSKYGSVLNISGCDLKDSYSSTSTTVYTAPWGKAMPYNRTVNSSNDLWFECVCGKTTGWVETCQGYAFKYKDLE